MEITVAFTPGEAASAPVAVALDVLRATSTICAALAGGFREVVCTTGVDEARALGVSEGARLAGERGCVRIEGFDFGNSPPELAAAAASGTLALSTTNGTRLLVEASRRCDRVYVGALVNMGAVVAAVRAERPAAVAILCAGVEGAFALDDAYYAGRLAAALGGNPSDSAVAAARLAGSFASPLEALAASSSAENLRRVGLGDDIAWCARESVLEVVPFVVARDEGSVRVRRL